MNRLLQHAVSWLATLLAAGAATACINEYGHTLSGKPIEMIGPPGRAHQIGDTALITPIKELLARYHRTHEPEDYCDYGAMLVYQGAYEAAKPVFQAVEQLQPGRYNTAANLGTTYELLGNNDSAYFWIKKAIALNPDSHYGSEWIHLRILDFKRKGWANQAYLKDHDILGLGFGNKVIPESSLPADSLEEIRLHLYDQLQERLSFVSPEDPVVAQLLSDLANLTLLTSDVETAAQEFRMAKEYGCSGTLFDQRKAYADQLDSSYRSERKFRAAHSSAPHIAGRTYGWLNRNKYWLGSGFLAAALSLVSFIRRRRINKYR